MRPLQRTPRTPRVDARLEAAAERVRKAGGQVLSEPIPTPFGQFFYAADPDGNSIGFFES